jgi:hypothetical protein
MSKSDVPAAARRIKQSDRDATGVRPDLSWRADPGDAIPMGPLGLEITDPVP